VVAHSGKNMGDVGYIALGTTLSWGMSDRGQATSLKERVPFKVVP